MGETMNRRQLLAWTGGGLAAAGVLWPGKAEALSGRSGESRPNHRSDPIPHPLPAVGTEIPFSGHAANAPLKLGTEVVHLDFKGGIRFRVETSSRAGLTMSVIGFEMTATDPVLGTVTMERADSELTPLSVLYVSNVSRHLRSQSRAVRTAPPCGTTEIGGDQRPGHPFTIAGQRHADRHRRRTGGRGGPTRDPQLLRITHRPLDPQPPATQHPLHVRRLTVQHRQQATPGR
ncbi:hypothetical protein ACIG5E_16810 [Kitasatospora sp. NPDC053057]|uniref:hypothetical protein n=1 Tax=Kitasatospora sp. NPDC053057 TaxID=3364062 RepID=UPI0037C764FA